MNKSVQFMISFVTLLTIASSGMAGDVAKVNLPTNLVGRLEEIQKRLGNSDTVRWFPGCFGNKEYIFCSRGVAPGFYRLCDADLSNRVQVPDGIRSQMLAGKRRIQMWKIADVWYFGNENFAVIYKESGEKDLISFSNSATLADLTLFVDRLYDEIVSPQIASRAMPPVYLALVELCMEAHIARLHTVCAMCAAGISYGSQSIISMWAFVDSQMNLRLMSAGTALALAPAAIIAIVSHSVKESNKEMFEAEIKRLKSIDVLSYLMDKNRFDSELDPKTLYDCCAVAPAPYVCDDIFSWSADTIKILSGMCVNQMVLAADVSECAAFRFGTALSMNTRGHLIRLMENIRANAGVNIRKDGYETSYFDLNGCEDFSDWWSDINRKEYLTSAAQLMKINRQILRAVTEKKYEDGFEELALLAEKWRPVMKRHVRNYHYLFSDLPVVLSCHAAFRETRESDAFWSCNKDRAKATGAAHQWIRSCADGDACRYIRSHYTANIMEQYHGYLKKVLGNDDYKNLETTLKISQKREDEEFPAALR